MTQPNPSTALARVVIDELARNGVDFIAISPGSRSGALAIAAVEDDRVAERVVLDERSAAFHALGRAKATGAPAAVLATSGTAPANFLPAVVEADMSLVPLVVISADRPAEMHGIRANQTIEQSGLFGPKVRYSSDIEAPDPGNDSNAVWRTEVSSAVAAAMGFGSSPGPVHLNIAFREPTVPVPDDGRTRAGVYSHPTSGRPDGKPWVCRHVGSPPSPGPEIPGSDRGLVVAGEGEYDGDALVAAAESLGWPVLATALSGLRGRGTVAAYHHVLADGVPDRLRPDVVVAVGAVGPSQRLESLIASARIRIRVDSWGRHIDPGRNATAVVHADPVQVLGSVTSRGSGGWADDWRSIDRQAAEALAEFMTESTVPSGAGVAWALNDAKWDILVAASSLPIREVDAHLRRKGRVLANRGASGIDGFVSTALGVSSAGGDVVALCGDLSLLHDSNGFLSDPRDDLILVIIDNNGGGLFDSLPQASHAPHFERVFIAPHNRNLERLADLHGVGYLETDDISELAGLVSDYGRVPGVHIIHVPVDRKDDLRVRQELDRIGASLTSSIQP